MFFSKETLTRLDSGKMTQSVGLNKFAWVLLVLQVRALHGFFGRISSFLLSKSCEMIGLVHVHLEVTIIT